MTILGFPLRELVIGLVALLTALFVAYDKYRQRKLTEAKGLDPNPERCEKHSIAIGKLEVRLDGIDGRLQRIEDKIEDL